MKDENSIPDGKFHGLVKGQKVRVKLLSTGEIITVTWLGLRDWLVGCPLFKKEDGHHIGLGYDCDIVKDGE